MKSKNLFCLALAGTLALTGCKKDDAAPDDPGGGTTNTNTPSGSTTPTPADADGVLWAINSSSVYQGFTIQIGTAVAVFKNGTSMVDAGTVKVDGTTMAKASNNAYTLTPSQSNPTGLTFGSSVNWNITGANGHAAFSYDCNTIQFPVGSAISSGATVTKTNGYTLSCPSISGADSTLFMVGNISKTIVGNATSYTFSASELSGLTAGTSVASIVPYKITSSTINGKKYYFGKETVNQLTVTIQ